MGPALGFIHRLEKDQPFKVCLNGRCGEIINLSDYYSSSSSELLQGQNKIMSVKAELPYKVHVRDNVLRKEGCLSSLRSHLSWAILVTLLHESFDI